MKQIRQVDPSVAVTVGGGISRIDEIADAPRCRCQRGPGRLGDSRWPHRCTRAQRAWVRRISGRQLLTIRACADTLLARRTRRHPSKPDVKGHGIVPSRSARVQGGRHQVGGRAGVVSIVRLPQPGIERLQSQTRLFTFGPSRVNQLARALRDLLRRCQSILREINESGCRANKCR